ncbi:hypothetical protein SteCoe_28935 [Stentor coeruleus]|uniref:Uncharacterized protein n=1 Tax=Stentor coeruleus TaxID=5963 RepID=A0A1R2B726_9CILI|nr:hypothetical protein SteCoe_28935 [Stentor coeruleus]
MNSLQSASKYSMLFNSPQLSYSIPDRFSDSSNMKTNTISYFKVNLTGPKISEFITQLTEQVRRISPGFSFNTNKEQPLEQVLGLYKSAVDKFMENYSKQLKGDYKKRSKGSVGGDIQVNEMNCPQDAKETMKKLLKYEQLLKKKEESLNYEKNRLFEQCENLKIIERNMQESHNSYEREKNEWYEEKVRDVERLENEKTRFNHEKEELEKIAIELKEIKCRIEIKEKEALSSFKIREENLKVFEKCLKDTKEELLEEKNKSTKEKINIEQEKWNLAQMQRKINEKEALLTLRNDHLALARAEVEKTKVELQQMKTKIDIENSQLQLAKKKFAMEKKKFEEQDQKFSLQNPNEISTVNLSYEGTLQSSFTYENKSIELTERENEIEKAYTELTQQMERFNAELEIREDCLEAEERRIILKAKELDTKIQELQEIEYFLLESKAHLEEFRISAIEEIETQIKSLQTLSVGLNQQKAHIEFLLDRLNRNIALVKRFGGDLKVIEEANCEHSPDSSPRYYGKIIQEDANKYLKDKEGQDYEADKEFGEEFEEFKDLS